jgi:hypothetical protein|tara:strand:+ start:173 stop:712 length:540 start_codon:yes stop_codon:yes gene_type:complete
MTAPKNTESFTTEESKSAEKNHTKWVGEIISEYGSNFTIRYKVKISDFVGEENNEYAFLQNGKSSDYLADGGFIYYKDKLIGVCEHKHQKALTNACERAIKYLSFMYDHEVFISTSGEGFSEEKMRAHSSATAKFLAVAKFGYKRKKLERGIGVSHNENEEEFKKTFRDWFEYLISKVV